MVWLTRAVLSALLVLAEFPVWGKDVLRVGTSGDYHPFSVDENGTLSGLDIDIARRLGRDLDVDIEFVRFRWPDLMDDLTQNKFDIVMSGVTMTGIRAASARFTRPYATTGAMLLFRIEDEQRFSDREAFNRRDVRVAVNRGGYLQQVAFNLFPEALIIPIDANRTLASMVLFGTVHAALTDSAEVRAWLRPELRTMGPLTTDYKGFLLPADRAQVAARIDRWLVAREQDGWLDGQRTQWLGKEASAPIDLTTRRAVCALIRLRLEMMPAIGERKRLDRLPIDDLAQEKKVIERARKQASDGVYVANVFSELISVSKLIQRSDPRSTVPGDLQQLRAAIERIDEQLVRELNRAPLAQPAEWRECLEAAVSFPSVAGTPLLRVAVALAAPLTEKLQLTPIATHAASRTRLSAGITPLSTPAATTAEPTR